MQYSNRRDELDQEYNRLVLEAQQFSEGAQRNLILNKLFSLILKDNRFYLLYKYRYNITYDDYQDCLQQTMIAIINNIDVYHLKKGSFIKWFKFILNRKIIDNYRKSQKNFHGDEIRSVTAMINRDNNLTLLDMIVDNQDEDDEKILIEELVNFIYNDPEKVLENCHARQNLNCNCKTIAQLILNDSKWKDISEKLQIPIATLYSLWNRKCIPLLRQHLQQFLEKGIELD